MYNPNFDNPEQKKMCEPALSALNNAIITESMKVYIQSSIIKFKIMFFV
jgi:hypothetical protein